MILGGDGNDVITVKGLVSGKIDGGAGNDIMSVAVNGGNVTLTGGAGADRFEITDKTGIVNITDFDFNGDKLALKSAGLNFSNASLDGTTLTLYYNDSNLKLTLENDNWSSLDTSGIDIYSKFVANNTIVYA